jgi:hypothetical protein
MSKSCESEALEAEAPLLAVAFQDAANQDETNKLACIRS